MLKHILHAARNVRWRLRNWSSASDRAFHDDLFARSAHDPFSSSYPGLITIKRFADLASAHIAADGAVLDLGCGPGEITCELARRFPDVEFIGIDHSDAAIAQAQSNAERLSLKNVLFESMDMLRFVPSQPLQLVAMFDSFHHLLEPAVFIETFSRFTDRFFLIEPIGNAIGQWRDSIDFDWVAIEVDAIRERLDEMFGVTGFSNIGQDAPPPDPAAAVERRYSYDDFERFFDGFSLTVKGTSSGLVVYPPCPSHTTRWRDEFGPHVYELYRAIDDRLFAENLDLLSRHWAILAARGPRGPRRSPADSRILRLSTGSVTAGAYSVEYESYDGSTSAPVDSQVHGVVRLKNTGTGSWSSDDPNPVNISYRWLSLRGVRVEAEEERTALPKVVAPGESVRSAIAIRTPGAPGTYILAIDLVRESVTWFSQRGHPPLEVKFRVTRK
jgi:SAM-dependent methyltransferase